MEQLIKVVFNDDLQVNSVDARELHKTLNVGTDFSDWVKRRIVGTMAEENVDYQVLKNDVPGKFGKLQEVIDYIISIHLAKEFAMLERNEEGKQVRKYFIKCESELLGRTKLPAKQLHPADEFAKYHSLAGLLGLKAEQAAIHANHATRKETGKDVLALMEYKVTTEVRTMSLTDIIKKYGISAIKGNKILRDKGFLDKDESGNWVLTKSGIDLGGKLVSKEGGGKMRQSVEWPESIKVHIVG